MSTSMELTDRPNLALVRDRGQRQRLEGGGVENLRCEFQLSVCDFLFFFHYWHVRRIEEAREKKKKKEDTAWTPESGELYQFWCPTHVGHQHVAKIGMSVQPRAQYPCSILIYLNRS